MANPVQVRLTRVTREDIEHVAKWLEDLEISEYWFGRYASGAPAHLGYEPQKMLQRSDEEIDHLFSHSRHESSRRFFAIRTMSGEHIGEAQLAVDEALGDAQLAILIGRKDLWNRGYGAASTLALLEYVFERLGLYRVWVDVPEYNTAARQMFEHIGFQHEGTLRKSRPRADARYNSVILGILQTEFHRLYPEPVESRVEIDEPSEQTAESGA